MGDGSSCLSLGFLERHRILICCNQATSEVHLRGPGTGRSLVDTGTKTRSLGRLVSCGCRDKCAYVHNWGAGRVLSL